MLALFRTIFGYCSDLPSMPHNAVRIWSSLSTGGEFGQGEGAFIGLILGGKHQLNRYIGIRSGGSEQ